MSTIYASHTTLVQSLEGIHVRPAELLARCAMRFKSDIELVIASAKADAKSILDILALGAQKGHRVRIVARGVDAPEAVQAVAELLASEFAMDTAAAPPGGAVDSPPRPVSESPSFI